MEPQPGNSVSPVRLVDFNRNEAKQVATDGLLLIPLGSTEQHGPHLPIGTDGMCAEYVAIRAASEIDAGFPTAVAPTLWYGSSEHHIPFGATASLRSETLLNALMDIGISLSKSGFKRLFFINGHGGNHELMFVAARDISRATGQRVGSCSWWAMPELDSRPGGSEHQVRIPGHAGAFETSVILAINPDLVRVTPPDRALGEERKGRWSRHSAVRTDDPAAWRSIDGYSDNPSGGSAEFGKKLLEAGTQAVVEAIRAFMRD